MPPEYGKHSGNRIAPPEGLMMSAMHLETTAANRVGKPTGLVTEGDFTNSMAGGRSLQELIKGEMGPPRCHRQ